MYLRPTSASTFSQVSRNILANQALLVRAQEGIATGKRILRPSDDPQGTGRALVLRRQLAELARFQGAVDGSTPVVQAGAAALEQGSEVLSRARALLVQGMNGTLSEADRATLGTEIEMLVEELLGLANSRFGDRHLFAGSRTPEAPFTRQGGAVRYVGDAAFTRVATGYGTHTAIGLPGSQVFMLEGLEAVELAGRTGLRLGSSANQGRGYAHVVVRHDATLGAPGSGLALAGGGAQDTLLGEQTLVVDAAAGTIRLGMGPPVALPDPSSPQALDLVVRDEHGAEVHLDVSGYDGTDSSTTLTGEGSIALDGGAFRPLDRTQSDLRLVGADGEVVLHLDATAVRRAGTEQVTFRGRSSVFDVLQAVAADLKGIHGGGSGEVLERLQTHLEQLDRHRERMLEGLSALGSRQAVLRDAGERLGGVAFELTALLSDVEDVDVTQVVLDAGRAEQTLQLVQMAGARLIQSSLLNFLR